jgi:hypothetical protein
VLTETHTKILYVMYNWYFIIMVCLECVFSFCQISRYFIHSNKTVITLYVKLKSYPLSKVNEKITAQWMIYPPYIYTYKVIISDGSKNILYREPEIGIIVLIRSRKIILHLILNNFFTYMFRILQNVFPQNHQRSITNIIKIIKNDILKKIKF